MLYIDSAERDELAPLLETGLFAGVTTNPLILRKAGLGADGLPPLLDWLRARGVSRFFAQATGETREDVRASATRILDLGEDVVVKLVATRVGLSVAREVTERGREVLVTAVYHPTQAVLAEAAGARAVAPYVGRAGDAGRDGVELVRSIIAVAPRTRVLAASIRSVDQLTEVMRAGAHEVTVSTQIAQALFDDELTARAAEEFETIANA